MIKVIICDGNGTLGLPNPSKDILDLLQTINKLGIKLTVASNKSRKVVENRFRKAGLNIPDVIVTPRDIGREKPKPEFVYRIKEQTGVELEEIAYIGDSDDTDIYCAINAGVLPIAAKYSNPSLQYGLPFDNPLDLKHFISTFCMQDTYFGWSYNGTCADTGKYIDIRALIGQHSVLTRQHSVLTKYLEGILKDGKDFKFGKRKFSLRELLYKYLVTQCYLSGLIQNIDWITVYPGHDPNNPNSTLEDYSGKLASLFRDKFIKDLLQRHQRAPKSQYQGSQRNIYDQFRTIMVNPRYKRQISGKRILVLDDFTTYGYSLETARRMLLQAEAQSVICVAIGKFRQAHSVTTISCSWNPFKPCTLRESHIHTRCHSGSFNIEADRYFYEKILTFYNYV